MRWGTDADFISWLMACKSLELFSRGCSFSSFVHFNDRENMEKLGTSHTHSSSSSTPLIRTSLSPAIYTKGSDGSSMLYIFQDPGTSPVAAVGAVPSLEVPQIIRGLSKGVWPTWASSAQQV